MTHHDAMTTKNMARMTYDTDIVAWAQEQARLLRAGRFDALDIEHIAEEIEDVGKSEQRELENRMAVLLAHLLKWQHQPDRSHIINSTCSDLLLGAARERLADLTSRAPWGPFFLGPVPIVTLPNPPASSP